MQMRLTKPRAKYPAVAPRDARVCLVECYDGVYVRVFGPYPRVRAERLREQWLRATPEHWRYEFWEDWDAAIVRHKRVEPGYVEENRRDYICSSVAHDTTPVYFVRLDAQLRVEETFFGPVPRKVARFGMCRDISVLNFISKNASECVTEQPPSSVGGDRGLEMLLGREWEAGRCLPFEMRLRPVPPKAEWPAFEGEPELMRNPEV